MLIPEETPAYSTEHCNRSRLDTFRDHLSHGSIAEGAAQ